MSRLFSKYNTKEGQSSGHFEFLESKLKCMYIVDIKNLISSKQDPKRRFEISHENSERLILESGSRIESLEILEISAVSVSGPLVESKRKRWKNHTGESWGCGPGLWLRWQKNRYDVFMRMARVCQADGIAIAARRISPKKNTK